jgi:ABC-type uncharacterized transport system permease subunit
MTFQKTTMATLATLGLGTLVTGAAWVQAAGFPELLSGFSLLVLSPYAVFCGACLLAASSIGRAIATFIVGALASAFAICLYVDLIFVNPGSMNGLVFYFVPTLQLAVAVLLLIVVFFTRPRRRKPAPDNGALQRTEAGG